jgi:hypothetical protein
MLVESLVNIESRMKADVKVLAIKMPAPLSPEIGVRSVKVQ